MAIVTLSIAQRVLTLNAVFKGTVWGLFSFHTPAARSNLAFHPYCTDNLRITLESFEKNTKVIAILRLPCYVALANFPVFLTPSVTDLRQKKPAEPHQQTSEVSRNLSRPRSVTICKLGKTCSDLTLLIEVMIC